MPDKELKLAVNNSLSSDPPTNLVRMASEMGQINNTNTSAINNNPDCEQDNSN